MYVHPIRILARSLFEQSRKGEWTTIVFFVLNRLNYRVPIMTHMLKDSTFHLLNNEDTLNDDKAIPLTLLIT